VHNTAYIVEFCLCTCGAVLLPSSLYRSNTNARYWYA